MLSDAVANASKCNKWLTGTTQKGRNKMRRSRARHKHDTIRHDTTQHNNNGDNKARESRRGEARRSGDVIYKKRQCETTRRGHGQIGRDD